MTKLILASTSKIRIAMLKNAGLDFAALAPQIDEELLKLQLSTTPNLNLALELAKCKALSIPSPEALIIGVDQTLTCLGTNFSKPKSVPEAKVQLKNLCGKSHVLCSALAIAQKGRILWSTSQTAELKMRSFSDEFITAYLNANAPDILHCVGAYQIEGQGIQLFDKVDGDYFTILGLPLLPLLAFLRQVGFLES